MITNPHSKTTLDEIADGLWRISTPLAIPGGGFSFNQFLIADDEPLLFHTGPRRLFPHVQEAIGRVLPVSSLRWIALSHVEADECGALSQFLAAAPQASPVCSRVAAMTSVEDLAGRPARALADGELLPLGRRRVRWIDAPHVPHGWECGFMFEETGRTLLCGDLFTQGGAENPPVTESDLVGPSEAFRAPMDYFAHAPHTRATLERMAAMEPALLACMHGSSFRGDGAAQLRALANALAATAPGAATA